MMIMTLEFHGRSFRIADTFAKKSLIVRQNGVVSGSFDLLPVHFNKRSVDQMIYGRMSHLMYHVTKYNVPFLKRSWSFN